MLISCFINSCFLQFGQVGKQMLIAEGKEQRIAYNKNLISNSPYEISTFLPEPPPRNYETLKNLYKIRNFNAIKQKYSNFIKPPTSAKQPKFQQQNLTIDHESDTRKGRQTFRTPKICQIKYLEEEQGNPHNILGKNNGFRSIKKKRSLKNSGKQFTDNKIKEQIKKLFSPNNSKRGHFLKERIKLETVYGTIRVNSPDKLPIQKIGIDTNNLQKRTKNKTNQKEHHLNNNQQVRPFLMISNNKVLQSHRHSEQLERLKLSLQNRKIEEKHRKANQNKSKQIQTYYWRETGYRRSKAESIQTKNHSLDIKKVKNREEAHNICSPWHDQNAQNDFLSQDFN